MKITTNKEMEIKDNSDVVMAPIINPSTQKNTVMEVGNYFAPTTPSDSKHSTLEKVAAIIGAILVVGFIVLAIVLSI